MADIPPAESVDDALRRATQAVDALKRAKPSTSAEARRRACEVIDAQREMLDAAHRITDAAATKRFTGTNGHAPAHGKQVDVLSDGVLDALAAGLVPFLKEMIADELEKRRVLTDGGIWTEGKTYSVGALVTHHGHAWACQRATNAKPGESNDWRMTARSHR